MASFEKHIFICMNERDESASRPSCLNEGSKKLKSALKDAIKEAGLKHRIRASEIGCLDQCEHAPVMVVYPDNVWYGMVKASDAEEIVREHLVGGQPVARLRLAESCINTADCPHRKRKHAK
jgi:(2Fe-2S) ferredoxin